MHGQEAGGRELAGWSGQEGLGGGGGAAQHGRGAPQDDDEAARRTQQRKEPEGIGHGRQHRGLQRAGMQTSSSLFYTHAEDLFPGSVQSLANYYFDKPAQIFRYLWNKRQP